MKYYVVGVVVVVVVLYFESTETVMLKIILFLITEDEIAIRDLSVATLQAEKILLLYKGCNSKIIMISN